MSGNIHVLMPNFHSKKSPWLICLAKGQEKSCKKKLRNESKDYLEFNDLKKNTQRFNNTKKEEK